MAAELERSPPEAVVVSGNVALPAEHPVRRLIEERWIAVPSALDQLRFELRVLPGSALADRLAPSGYGDSSPQE